MKQSQTSVLRRINVFLTSALRSTIKFLSPLLRRAKKALKPAALQAKEFLSTKNGKLVALVAVLILVLIIGLTRCSKEETPSTEMPIGTIASDILEVHKKPKESSPVLGILPLDQEVEILEEKAAQGTTWGRIEETTLPNGKVVEGGWIDLQFVDFTDDSDVPVAETEPVPADEPDIPPVLVTMGTITASKLNVRKGPGSDYDSEGFLYKGDRVEILETKTDEDTVWGRTHEGWVGMGYVRMDGTYTSDSEPESSSSVTKSDGNTTVLGYGIVTLNELNVRLGPDTIYGKAGTIPRGSRYAYYQLLDGWARIECGWVSAEHFYVEGTATYDAFRGIVNTDSLNVRTGPHTNYMLIDTYAQGETVDVLAKFGDWGYTEKGWVFLDYLDPSYTTGTGTITTGLNVRTEPNADSEIAGTYKQGDQITILEVTDNWGLTDLGWINLKYVAYD